MHHPDGLPSIGPRLGPSVRESSYSIGGVRFGALDWGGSSRNSIPGGLAPQMHLGRANSGNAPRFLGVLLLGVLRETVPFESIDCECPSD